MSNQQNPNAKLMKTVFLILSFCLGMLLWFIWHGNFIDYSQKAINLDNKVTSVLYEAGVKDIDIVSQSRIELKSGISKWIEFYKELKINPGVSLEELKEKLKSAALAGNLQYVNTELGFSKEICKIGTKDKIFARLVFVVPEHKNNKVAIVIDDLGYKSDISGFLGLGVPITLAVLPHEKYSKQIARELTSKKIPFILHLPLEPEKYPSVDPGHFALLLKMNDKEIEKMFNTDIESVPGVAGVSNHMGSAFSADEAKMKVLLALVKKKGLFYFDSYTSQQSKAKKAAVSLGVKHAVNGLFLDLEDTPEFMDKQFLFVLERAKKHGQFIAIGHYQKKNMIPMLKKYIPIFKKEKIDFVYINDLVSEK